MTETPDLATIARDLYALATTAERIVGEGEPMADDYPTTLADLAEAVASWADAVGDLADL